MKRVSRSVVVVLLVPSLAAALIDCSDDENASTPPAADAAALDTSTTAKDAGGVDAAVDAGNATDTGASDTGTDTGTDSATLDAGMDAPSDTGVDSGPQFDDAGCPLSTGPLPELTDAGFPTNGLVLWLRGDRGVATVDGGSVCRWDDMSGNGRSFVPFSAQAPVLAPTGLRNQPAVSFVGARTMGREDVLGIAPTSARTIAIFQAHTDTTRRFAFYQGNYATNDTYFGIDQNTFNTVGSREGVYIHGNAFDSNVTTSGLPRSHIYSIASMVPDGGLPGVLTYAVDNTVTTLTRTAGGTGNSKVWDFTSAHRTTFGTIDPAYTGGLIGEVLVFDRELSSGERTTVHQYFQSHFPP